MFVSAELVYLGEKEITKKNKEVVKLPVFVCPHDKEQVIPFTDEVNRAKISNLPEFERVKVSMTIQQYNGKINYNITEIVKARPSQASSTGT